MADADDVLDFWFGLAPQARFKRDDAVDAEIAKRFGRLHTELSAHVSAAWRATPRDVLSAIIVLDQFSRNLFRDDRRAFAQDAAALTLVREALDQGWDSALSVDEKQFLYMPLMHSETLADVEQCVALMEAAGHGQGEDFARRHAAIIFRFGRYPARNSALGRATTAEERAFLAANPAGF